MNNLPSIYWKINVCIMKSLQFWTRETVTFKAVTEMTFEFINGKSALFLYISLTTELLVCSLGNDIFFKYIHCFLLANISIVLLYKSSRGRIELFLDSVKMCEMTASVLHRK